MSQFLVFPYVHDLLREQIAALAHHDTTPSAVEKKAQDDYLRGYLTDMGARCFVVETRYVDRDYLEEHAAYYVRCFREYRRFCSRIHFLSVELSQDQVDDLTAGICQEELLELLRSNYLGFVVIKPLPQKFFGRTCLKTYPPEANGSTRHYPALVNYDAHLAGITLPVRSLAFQEQDHGVAACATSAVWSAFQITGRIFHHPILSPAAITQAAVSGAKQGRVFPSEGLSVGEICQACRAVGLDAEVFAVPRQPESEFKSIVHGYLAGGLPVILVVQLLNLPDQEGPSFHAVTLSGYSMGPAVVDAWRASRMDKVYAHDDQVGPFARMGIATRQVQAFQDARPTLRTVLTTSWQDANGGRGGLDNVVAVPLWAVVPIYHKIRVSIRELLRDVARVQYLFGELVNILPVLGPAPSHWGLELKMIPDLKAEWRQDELLPPGEKARLLRAFLPRFTWVLTARNAQDIAVFDVLVDATDTCDGACVADVVVRDPAAFAHVAAMAEVLVGIPQAPPNHLIECLAQRAP